MFKKKKGVVFIIGIFLCMAMIFLLAFAFDVSRMVAYKSILKTTASAISLSLVNESSYIHFDSLNGPRSEVVYNANKDKQPVDFKNRYVLDNSLKTEIIKYNNKNFDSGLQLTSENVYINPTFGGAKYGINYKNFITGRDNKNGEVTVLIVQPVKSFYFWRYGSIVLIEKATSQAQALSLNKEQINWSSIKKQFLMK